MTEPRFLPSLVRSSVRGDAESCRLRLRTAATPAVGAPSGLLGSQSRASRPSLRPPARPAIQYSAITALTRGCLGLGWLLEKRAEAGWFASWGLSGGREMQRAGAGHHRGNLHMPLAPSDRHRPQAVEFGCAHLGFPSQRVTLGSCAFGRQGLQAGAPRVDGEPGPGCG